MARFIFSLQNILNMKEKLEDQAKNDFAQANLRLSEAIAEQKALERRLQKEKQKLQQEISAALDIGKIRRREDAIDILRMYVMQQILVVKQREKEAEVAREHLNEAMKERKTFEKLREKAYEAYVAEENLREQKEVDELVSYRYGVNDKE